MIVIRGKIWDSVQEEAETLTLTQVPPLVLCANSVPASCPRSAKTPPQGCPWRLSPSPVSEVLFCLPLQIPNLPLNRQWSLGGPGLGESLRKERKMSLCWCREVRTRDYNQHLEEPLGRHLHPEKVIQCQGCRSGG